ncbi:hypothetical protein CAPTEDRAFT_207614 [Capitella teleta]|uniref:Uncharacterized protein n=1 Tax=Capitella teleta TaxID=283909 RepID=R7V2M5_CAPTE|nr:hypothetical protein CAPTEDRAFT_207614 [Capitella teleta]|eukprot:ELU13103.1 hypothetical protein CAPTEDRAFT_207614 [Capitella teleta]
MGSSRPGRATASYITAKSTSNQRIEAFWGQLRKQCTDHWIDLLSTLEEAGYFVGDFVDKNIMQFTLTGVIQLGVYMQYTSSFYCCVGREASNIYVKECHHFGIIIMVAQRIGFHSDHLEQPYNPEEPKKSSQWKTERYVSRAKPLQYTIVYHSDATGGNWTAPRTVHCEEFHSM